MNIIDNSKDWTWLEWSLTLRYVFSKSWEHFVGQEFHHSAVKTPRHQSYSSPATVLGPGLRQTNTSIPKSEWYGGWLRNPAPVDRWFIPLLIRFQLSGWWCRISQASTVSKRWRKKHCKHRLLRLSPHEPPHLKSCPSCKDALFHLKPWLELKSSKL